MVTHYRATAATGVGSNLSVWWTGLRLSLWSYASLPRAHPGRPNKPTPNLASVYSMYSEDDRC